MTRVEDVPRIFLQETIIAAGRDIVEQRIEPQAGLPSPVIRSLGGLPPLYGYNGTEVREAARTLLFTPDGKPLLAQWQYGLGRVVAWTSDVQGRWARDWIAWDQFPRFAGGLADLLLPPRESGALELRATVVGPRAVLELTAQDEQGRPLNNLVIAGAPSIRRIREPQFSFNRSVLVSIARSSIHRRRACIWRRWRRPMKRGVSLALL